jgi:hypothetical protein
MADENGWTCPIQETAFICAIDKFQVRSWIWMSRLPSSTIVSRVDTLPKESCQLWQSASKFNLIFENRDDDEMEHKEFWQKVESVLKHYELSYAPVRWFGGWGGLTRGREGYFVFFRLIFLITLYLIAFYLPPYFWLKILMTIAAGYSIADMFLIPTSLAFGGIHDMRPLRALVFVLITYISIAIAFGVLYITLCRSSFDITPEIINPIYSTFSIMTTLGTGDMSLARQAMLVRFLIISEVVIGIYFWAVVVGIIISWTARESKC